MNKKLTAKVQKINPKLPDETNNISNCLVIEPDDEMTLEKKGIIYATFDISGKKFLDNLLVTKIVNDVLHDSYFQSETASPVQSMEKSILKLRDSISQLTKAGGPVDTDLVFNLAAAILWGNTLYLVQYGSTKIFLMRDGKVKSIEAATEGKFSVASGVIKDNDVIILATENFSEKFPPDKLVSADGLQLDKLDALESCLILKFSVVKEFSKDETIDFGMDSSAQAIDEKDELPNQQRQKLKLMQKTSNVKDIYKTSVRSKKPKWLIFLLVIPIIILIFAFAKFAISKLSNDEEETSNAQSTETPENNDAIPAPIVINEEEDKQNKVIRVESKIFYDLKIADENASSSEIAVLGDRLFVSDKSSGKLYVSDLSTPKLVPIETTYQQIRNLINYDGNLGFVDNEGFKSLDNTNKIVEDYKVDNLNVTSNYLDFIYSISGNTLTKYTKADTTLTGSLWAEDTDLNGSISMGIDFSIYILNQNGSLLKYTSGEQDAFEIAGIDKPFDRPIQLVTNVDLENIYIADTGNKRIVVLDKEGNFVKQYRLRDEAAWNDVKGIGISEDETKGYVLNGNKIFEIDLTLEPQ